MVIAKTRQERERKAMGQILHGRARTTEATRYDINPKTIAKWSTRQDEKDQPMSTKEAHLHSMKQE